MEILGLLKQLGALAAVFYAAVGAIALGLFFWDRQPRTRRVGEPAEAQGLGASQHASRSPATLQPTA